MMIEKTTRQGVRTGLSLSFVQRRRQNREKSAFVFPVERPQTVRFPLHRRLQHKTCSFFREEPSLNPIPHWRSQQTVLSERETAVRVAAAADQLVVTLEAAEQLTCGWTDENLSDALVERAMSTCLAQLAVTGRWGRENQLPSTAIWKTAGDRLKTGWLQLRAREKPLGYAGDYKMLAAIIDNRCCDDPLGRCFDRYFQAQAAPMAVRSRTDLVANTLAARCLAGGGDEYQVVSVGAGPAIDIQRGIAMLPQPERAAIRTTLLDLDDESLDFAKQTVLRVASPRQVACHRENLFRLARRPAAADLIGSPNLIVCTGLFDYLEDDVARAMLRLFWDRLAGGGGLLVGNFDPHHATRAYMEWIGNWYLTYRTIAQLAELAETAEIPSDCRWLGTDATGADVFLGAVKPS